jgi:hypothetical protein
MAFLTGFQCAQRDAATIFIFLLHERARRDMRGGRGGGGRDEGEKPPQKMKDL